MNPEGLIDEAIKAIEATLTVHATYGSPADWASLLVNLSTTLQNYPYDDGGEHDQRALWAAEAAVGVFVAGVYGVDAAYEFKSAENPYWNDEIVRRAPHTTASWQRGQARYDHAEFLKDFSEALIKLGSLYSSRSRGDLGRNVEMALRCYYKALRHTSRRRAPNRWARIHNNLGNAFSRRITGDPLRNCVRAIAHLERAHAVHATNSSPFSVAQTRHNLGSLYLTLAEMLPSGTAERRWIVRRSVELLEAALHVRTEEDHPIHWAMSCTMLARAFVTETGPGSSTFDADRARQMVERALEAVPLDRLLPIGYTRALLTLGLACEKVGRLGAARRYFTAAAHHAGRLNLLLESLEATLGASRALVALNQPSEAYNTLDAALQRIEFTLADVDWESTQRAVSRLVQQHYDLAVRLSWLENPERALLWSERARARALADRIGSRINPPLGIDAALYDNYLKLRSEKRTCERLLESASVESTTDDSILGRIDALVERIDGLNRGIQSALQQIRDADPSWSAAYVPIDLDGIRSAVRLSGQPVLALRVDDEGAYGWLITADGQISSSYWRGFGRARVAQWLDHIHPQGRALRAALPIRRVISVPPADPEVSQRDVHPKHPPRDSLDRMLGILWTDFLGDVDQWMTDRLGGKSDTRRDVTLVASQLLAGVPLSAAWRVEDGVRRYWADDWAVSYVPSIATLSSLIRRTGRSRDRYLGFADANDLPWTNLEVQAVARWFSHRDVLWPASDGNDRPRPSADDVLASLRCGADVIHFACHGVHDLQDPWRRSGLFIEQSAREPDLTVDRIDSAGVMPCALAILSACESASTHPADRAEEFVGLPAAFLVAGARTCIGTLWKVNDLATALLMCKLAELMFSDRRLAASRALAEAQSWLRTATIDDLNAVATELLSSAEPEDSIATALDGHLGNCFAHPYYWAAFICLGAPDIH